MHSRDPGSVGGDKRDSGPAQSLGDIGEAVEELGLDDKPEVLLLVALAIVAEALEEKLLEVLLLVQHEFRIRNHEVVLGALRVGPLLVQSKR